MLFFLDDDDKQAPTRHHHAAVHSTLRSRSRSPSPSVPEPPSPVRDADWVDKYSPYEKGLPLYSARTSIGPSGGGLDGTQDSSMQVIDSSTARRRGGQGPVVEGVHLTSGTARRHAGGLPRVGDDAGDDGDESEDDGGKGDKSHWPMSGIGMEEQMNQVVQPSGAREFLPANTRKAKESSKWDKLIPDQRHNPTWVSEL